MQDERHGPPTRPGGPPITSLRVAYNCGHFMVYWGDWTLAR